MSAGLLIPDVPIRFLDVTRQAGLTEPIIYGGVESQRYILETAGTGLAIFDYNKDGKPDILLVNGSRLNLTEEAPTNRLYRNRGGGRFEDVTSSAGLIHSGWGQAACVGDIDNDGWTDLCITYYGEIVLYRNRGDGTFEDISKQSKIGGVDRWNAGATFLDFDRDADLDLFVANYVDYDDAARYEPGSTNCLWKGLPVMCGPMGLKFSPNQLFRNEGNGTFTDVSASSRVTETEGFYSFMPITLDFNRDGWTDVYVACDSTPNILYQNNGDGTFSDIGLISGAAVSEEGREQAGMGVAAGDYDRDGYPDLFTTNFSDDTSTLYRNSGDGTFADVTFNAGLGAVTRHLSWGTGLVDFDNDGWKDIFVVSGHVYPEVDRHPSEVTYRQPRLVYHNLGDGTFQDVSALAGPAILEQKASRGAAFEDLDGDGDVDVVIVNLNDVPSLLRNDSPGKQNWLTLELEGERSNRSAIGALIRVTAEGRSQSAEVRSGTSYYSSSGLRVHFGLGRATRVETIEISWPSGIQQMLRNVEANRVLSIRERAESDTSF